MNVDAVDKTNDVMILCTIHVHILGKSSKQWRYYCHREWPRLALRGYKQRERERCLYYSSWTFFQIGEKVDARDLSMGAWFEAQVVKVTTGSPQTDDPCSSTSQDKETTCIYYHVQYDE